MVLDPQDSPEEIKSKEAELGLKVGLLWPRLFLDSGATDIVFVALFCTAVETTASCVVHQLLRSGEGTLPNIFVVLAAVHGILGLPGWCVRSSLHSFSPSPHLLFPS